MEMGFKKQMREWIDTLNHWTEAYDRGEALVSDKEWDDLYFALLDLEKTRNFHYDDSPTCSVYFAEVSKLEKVTHNHPMLSLAKTKSLDELKEFTKGKSICSMCKMDGLTVSLHYENGHLVSAETRGNGTVGENVFHNARLIQNIPMTIPHKSPITIDGEVIMDYNTFESFGDTFKNPRNAAAGAIRRLSAIESKGLHLRFIAWDIIDNTDSTLFAKLDRLVGYGFEVVPFDGTDDGSQIEEQINWLKATAKREGYPIDGIVFKYNRCDAYEAAGRTDHHFRGGIAYKFYDEEYETQLIDIEWTMGRTGILTPVAIFEPVDDGESIIERASLHNISIMYQILAQPFKGQYIHVAKMNMIIPQIVSAEDGDGTPISIPKVCPICGKEVEIVKSDSGTKNLICINPVCSGKLINRIDHFFGKKGLDAKGISKATIEKLIDWGWVNSISDMFQLDSYYDEWVNKPGFGKKSVDKILDSIEVAIGKVNLAKFITAIGIPEIGGHAAKDIAKEYNTYIEFRDGVMAGDNFMKLPGIGEVMYNNILNFDYTEADKIAHYFTDDISYYEDVGGAALEGFTFVITGKLHLYKNRDALKEVIIANGGKVTDSVTSKTNYLINNDIESNSSKNKKAKELDVLIITEEEFNDMIK